MKNPTVKMKSRVVPTFWYKDSDSEVKRNLIEMLPYFT